jgi:predicted negative regulator of RcsB-dependent stress response
MLLLAACSREESGKVDNIQLARFYADNGTYTLALSTLGQEQQKNPNDLRVYRELARIYHDLGYNSDALAEIDKAIEKGCEDCGELRLRILIASGKAAEADKQLASLGRTLPQERADFYRVQIDLRRNGDRQQALKRLESMALPEARSEYLRLLFAGQRYPEIVEIYQQRKGKPSPLDDMLLFAKTLYLLKRHEEADRALIELRLADKSDVITPRKIQTVELQVKNNIAQNKFTEAQAIYDAFLENYKGSGYVAMQEAVKDLKSSNFDDAIKNIEGLVEASPDNLQSAMILALAQFGKGDYRAVVNTLTLFRDRLDAAGKSLLAKAHLNLGQAEPVLELIPADAREPALALDRASAWLLKGKQDKARRLIDRVDTAKLKQNELLQYAQLLVRLGEQERLAGLLANRELSDPRLQRMLLSALLAGQRVEEAERYARSVKDPRQSLELQIYLALQKKDQKTALELQRKLTRDRQLKSDEAKLAALYLANRQIDEGFAAIQRGFAKPGDNAPFLKMLRVLLQKEDRPGIREWMAAQPSTVDGYDELQLLLAQAEIKTDPQQAKQRLQALMEKNDPRAVILMAQAEPDRGVAILQQALERKYHPLIAQLLYQYHLKKGDREALKLLLEQIEQKQQEGPQKDALLARGYLRLGDRVKASAFADQLEKKGLKAQALELKGDIELAARQPKQAIRAYAAALGMQPADALATKLFQTRISAGEKPETVLQEAERLLQRHPRFSTLKGFIAASYLQSRPQQARLLYEQIVSEQRNNVTAMNNLAWLYLSSDPRRALELSSRAFRLAPRNLNVADTYIRALDASGQRDKARELLGRLREKNPDSRILQQLASQLS